MKRTKVQPKATITHFFIYALSFLILWEWLRPIPTVTNTGHIDVFVWYALFSAVLIYFRTPLKLSVPLLLTGSIYGLHYIFHEGPFLSREGGGETVTMFLREVSYNVQLIFSWELASLTDHFRTFLLFLLLALICYLIYFWVFYTKKIFVFLLATVIYITILDTFTPVDASMAIIRIVVIGFFIMTLLHMLKVQEEEKEIGRRSTAFISSAWMYTLIFMILIATSVGYAAPKFEPQWGDPVPTFKRYVLGESSGSGEGVRRVGYGENDERLGGGFIQDHGTVFYADMEEPAYWRGESKHEYTGHGWQSDQDYYDSRTVFENNIDYLMFEEATALEESIATVTMEDGIGFNHFFYPGQLTGVNIGSLAYSVDGDSENLPPLEFSTDIIGGKILAEVSSGDDVQLTEYTLQFDNPQFPIHKLEDSSLEDPEEIQDLYLQLPDDLPDRVVELAEEITADYDNRYDMAVAVEQYFSENDFEYRTTNIPVPDDDEDYVDQFLFETQFGYCDNYSTAMAVLLRAVDVPTRWVKGFTEGEEIETLDNGQNRYEVTNSNAHSWVEVYFPEVGWVPFEPTQGFANNIDIFEEEEEGSEIEIDGNEEQDNESERPDMDDMIPPMEEDYDNPEAAASSGSGGSSPLTALLTPKNVLISVGVLVLVMVIYQKQSRLQNRYFMFRYRLSQRDEHFKPAYRRLLWILENEGIPMNDGETLREYAVRVDRILNSMSMSKLTDTYERLYYGKRDGNVDWKKQHKQWEELVKSINS